METGLGRGRGGPPATALAMACADILRGKGDFSDPRFTRLLRCGDLFQFCTFIFNYRWNEWGQRDWLAQDLVCVICEDAIKEPVCCLNLMKVASAGNNNLSSLENTHGNAFTLEVSYARPLALTLKRIWASTLSLLFWVHVILIIVILRIDALVNRPLKSAEEAIDP